jgi:aryl-alcohol dehydrogenase-like predicted oxidoreductase
MRYRKLGDSGVTVSEIGIGCGGLGVERLSGAEQSLNWAFDHGVTLYDTAVSYANGKSEELLGRVFAGRREKIVLATKFGTVIQPDGTARKDFSAAGMRAAFEISLRRLGTDHVDIYQLHNPPMTVLDDDELWRELDRLLDAGKLRCYGLSIDDGASACRFLDATRGRSIQILINLFAQKDRPFFDEAARRRAGVIIKVPMAGGALTGRFSPDYPPPTDSRRRRWGEENFRQRLELVEKVRPVLEQPGRTMTQGALAWLLSFDAVSAVIPGISSLEKVQEVVGAGGQRLSADEMRALDEMDGGLIRDLRLSW